MTMGNVESHDFIPVWDPEHKVLDLKHVVTHSDFNKHVKGKCDHSECLENLPSNILEEISLYESIIASFNHLMELPSALPLHLPHLSHIDLSYNLLAELPNSLCLFFHLRTLLLHHNQLKLLPDSFSNLHKLEKVDLSYNKLEALPDDFSRLQQLKKINVSFNRLKYLPDSLIKCKNLTVILATQNECINPPQDVCDAGSQEIICYMKKNFSSPESSNCKDGNIFRRVRLNQLQSPSLDPNCSKVQYVQKKTDTVYFSNRVKTPLVYPAAATSFSHEEMKDKILGLIYGAAVGDALGLATDLMSPDESSFHYDEESLSYSDIIIDQHRLHWQQGQWTSATDCMLVVLDSIIHWAGVVDELDFAQRLTHWKKYGLLNNNVSGYTTSKIIDEVIAKDDFVSDPHSVAASLLQTNCNGTCEANDFASMNSFFSIDSAALPAAIVLGILHFHNLTEVISNSVRICRATHADLRCISSNVAVSCITALLLQGKHDIWKSNDIQSLVGIARLLAVENLSDVEHIKQFNKCFTELDLQCSLQNAIGDGHPFDTLKIALSALHSCKEYREILPKIVMHGGQSTVHGCMAGAFLGCRTGFKRLPSDWVDGLHQQHRNWLNSKINILLDMMGIP